MINRKLLEASDLDSDPAFITFNITRPPMAGEVQKKRGWEKVGWSVDSFVQSDLFQVRLQYFFLLLVILYTYTVLSAHYILIYRSIVVHDLSKKVADKRGWLKIGN